MSVNENRRKRDFAQYDSMSTEDLERILRQDAEAPAEQESDTDKLLYVMEVLARRNRETNCTGATPQEAWTSFQEHYAPDPEAVKFDKPARPWLRRLIAAAAAVLLILSIPVTARAFGWEELWNVVARWAKDTFSFTSEDSEQVDDPEASDAIEYTSLQDMLERNKIDSRILPSSIPKDFVLDTVEKYVTPEEEIFRATYSDNERKLTIRVQLYSANKSQNSEIEAETSEVYRTSNGEYYLFSNYDQIQIIWIVGQYECVIFGNITYEEAIAMINSIERG